ncbi:UDP-N-acetylglucosamine transferase subunit ALG14 homolog [Sitodiplosis mosellana]|uniref:UDP-N-acetylglucosamine transferase subunit ALG14 homolog n=1 Tax=Sitodiplosis mosellana TaxID=263140 RepID=UPI002444BE6D|nr:UDP-N-acetylglucosamine transferase subunit ALG14 homolog [Sitodiplosis mosellana]
MFLLFVVLLKVAVFLLAIRYYYLTNVASAVHIRRRKPVKTLIVLGSGGHTAEMMTIVKQLNKKNYSPRYYILASTDSTSESKVLDFEEPTTSKNDYEIFRIKRSRHVGQSYLTSVFTTIQSIWQCIPLIYQVQPDLVLCNGPGTCVPICLIAFMLKVIGAINVQCKIVFIESFCRVKTVSLSGKILVWISDSFVVQWPQLVNFSPKTKYFGRLF